VRCVPCLNLRNLCNLWFPPCLGPWRWDSGTPDARSADAPTRHLSQQAAPYLLLTPQLVITVVFFYWPAVQAVYYSVLLQDPFGLRTSFIWLENFQTISRTPCISDRSK